MAGYSYDAAGNLLSDGLFNVYSWDSLGQQVSNGSAIYLYDAAGQRIEKQGVGVTDTVYFGGNPVARLSAGQWTDLVYGPTGLLAEVPGTQTGSPVYRVGDHLGSSAASLLADGTLVNPVDYTPFGQVFSGTAADPYQFTSYERDSESGNDYADARYYASTYQGRFTSPDPYLGSMDIDNPQSLNRYTYAMNNPLKFVDPSGLTPICHVYTYIENGSVSDDYAGGTYADIYCYDDGNSGGPAGVPANASGGGGGGGTAIGPAPKKQPQTPTQTCSAIASNYAKEQMATNGEAWTKGWGTIVLGALGGWKGVLGAAGGAVLSSSGTGGENAMLEAETQKYTAKWKAAGCSGNLPASQFGH